MGLGLGFGLVSRDLESLGKLVYLLGLLVLSFSTSCPGCDSRRRVYIFFFSLLYFDRENLDDQVPLRLLRDYHLHNLLSLCFVTHYCV